MKNTKHTYKQESLSGIQDVKNRNQITKIIEQMDNPIGCEVGVRTGDFFKTLYTSNVQKMYAIDIWKDTGTLSQNDLGLNQHQLDNQYKNFCKKYQLDSKVKVIRDFSEKASKNFPDNYFDFVYLDADHSYEGVSIDLQAWYPKLKIGGLFGGHDYVAASKRMSFGVIGAVDEFVNNLKTSNQPVDLYITPCGWPSWFFIKV